MKLSEAKHIRGQLLGAINNQSPLELTEKARNYEKALSGFQGTLHGLGRANRHNRIAIGYSFLSTKADDVILEVRVRTQGRKGKEVARQLRKRLGDQVRVRYYKSPTLLTGASSANVADSLEETDEPNEANGSLPEGCQEELINLLKSSVQSDAWGWHGRSIGSVEGSTGSLGFFAEDDKSESGDLVVVSCSHVFAAPPGSRGKEGVDIYIPGPVDYAPANNQCAALRTFDYLVPSGQQKLTNETDSATATLINKRRPENRVPDHRCIPSDLRGEEILELPSSARLKMGSLVYKIGRSTGFTTGRLSGTSIDQIFLTYGANGDQQNFFFNNVIEVEWLEESMPFSKTGDSGSLVFMKIGKKLYGIGLVFGMGEVRDENSNSYSRVSFVSTLSNILRRNNISWLETE